MGGGFLYISVHHSRCSDTSLSSLSHGAVVISCLLCMSCCITPRQLHNSPIYTPSFASGHKHTFSHTAQLAQNKQSQQGVSGDTFPFDVRCF